MKIRFNVLVQNRKILWIIKSGLMLICLTLLFACKPEDDPSCGSSMIFINKTPETLEIKINNAIPSGCGYVGPEDKCSSLVSPNVTFTYSAKGSKGTTWSGSNAVPKCTDYTLGFTY